MKLTHTRKCASVRVCKRRLSTHVCSRLTPCGVGAPPDPRLPATRPPARSSPSSDRQRAAGTSPPLPFLPTRHRGPRGGLTAAPVGRSAGPRVRRGSPAGHSHGGPGPAGRPLPPGRRSTRRDRRGRRLGSPGQQRSRRDEPGSRPPRAGRREENRRSPPPPVPLAGRAIARAQRALRPGPAAARRGKDRAAPTPGGRRLQLPTSGKVFCCRSRNLSGIPSGAVRPDTRPGRGGAGAETGARLRGSSARPAGALGARPRRRPRAGAGDEQTRCPARRAPCPVLPFATGALPLGAARVPGPLRPARPRPRQTQPRVPENVSPAAVSKSPVKVARQVPSLPMVLSARRAAPGGTGWARGRSAAGSFASKAARRGG